MEIKTGTLGPTWHDFETARMKREDEALARKWVMFTWLGRGHLRPDLCYRSMEDEY